MYFSKVVTACGNNFLQLPVLLFPCICVYVYVLGKDYKMFGTLNAIPTILGNCHLCLTNVCLSLTLRK